MKYLNLTRQGTYLGTMAIKELERFSNIVKLPSLFLSIPVVLLAVLMTACSSSVKLEDPALPHGFADVGVPDVDLGAYVYVAQESPIFVPTNLFGNFETVTVNTMSNDTVEWLMVFLGPTLKDFGGWVRFGETTKNRELSQAMKKAPADQSVWRHTYGPELRFVFSQAQWATDARAALENGRMVLLEDKYPAMWESMRLLPSNPDELKPVAAGFISTTGDLIRPLLDGQGVAGVDVSSALKFARVDYLVFAAYVDHQLRLPDAGIQDYLRSADIGVIIVGRTSYPGFITSMLFGGFTKHVGLVDVVVNGELVKYRALGDDLHMMIKNFGDVLYFTVGTSRGHTESLMTKVLAQQG